MLSGPALCAVEMTRYPKANTTPARACEAASRLFHLNAVRVCARKTNEFRTRQTEHEKAFRRRAAACLFDSCDLAERKVNDQRFYLSVPDNRFIVGLHRSNS